MKKSLIVLGLCAAATLLAQGPPPGRGFGRMGPGGPGAMMGMGRGGGLTRTVTGAPYSAVEVTQSTQTLPNGNVITQTRQMSVYRDSQGRVRTETTLPQQRREGGQTAEGTPRTMIRIEDPVAGVSRVLDTRAKVSRETPLPGFRGRGGAAAASGGRGGRGGRTNEPARGNARGAGADPNVATESLPMQNMNGVMATGTRVTRTIPAGQIGNAQPIQIVRETWVSPDLKVPVMVRSSDPRSRTTTTQLTNIVRSEPDPALFQAPADYKVTRAGRGPGGMRRPPAGGTVNQ
ncbi:MAG: hypothetical protein ABSF25_18485 [Bryobacteraceae bacterium]